MENQTGHNPSPHVMVIPALSTIPEAASILRFKSPTSVYEMLEAGKLRSSVIGGKRLIVGQSIVELLRESEQQEYSPSRASPNSGAKKNTDRIVKAVAA